ncbi:MAG: radical SAM protein [Bacillota bacterium]
MSDEFRIDTHKLIFHPTRVSEWLQGKNIYPIYVEIAPSGNCNHRCMFCALDYLEYKPIFLDKELLLRNLQEMAGRGVKSVMYAGEGEPLLNKNTPDIIRQTRLLGIDVAMTTNGVLFSKEVAEECLGSCTWVRFSVNAGTSGTYHEVHRGRPEDFERVLTNLGNAVEVKRKKGLKTTIGVQMLLIPQNFHEAVSMGKILKEIGVDYFSIKPFSQHPKSICTIDPSFKYEDHLEIEQQLGELSNDTFRIVFRSNAMRKLKLSRSYRRCLGLPFWAYIDANARVWACSAYLGDEKFCYGSLKEENFMGIWEGERRSKILAWVKNMDVTDCREICRLDEINAYLHQLKNPGGHVNFI